MPEPSDTTKYDVAISFLSADVDTAKTVAEKLSPLKVFFFPRNQEDVAGTDGMEKFRAAFRYESRIQVVLYRKGWGETPWTGVEETAITERCLAEGWRGLFFVALAPDPKPNWVPDTKVYLDLSLYSMDELIGAIKLRAQELGAELRRQTPAEKARKALQRAEFEKETQELFRRETGVALVREQAGVVCDVLESEFKAAADEKIAPRIVRPVPVNIAFTTDRVGLIMGLKCPINMVADDAGFEVQFFKHPIVLPGEGRYYVTPGLPKRHRLDKYKVHRDMQLGVCWAGRDGKLLSSTALAEQILDDYWALYEESVTNPLELDW